LRRILALPDRIPRVNPSAWVAPNATLVGRVDIEEQSSIWYSAVLRGDDGSITVGSRTNIQDGCVLHADAAPPLVIGDGVTVGHRAILHGCTIEADVLVGMGAVVMDGAVIGRGSIVGAGAVVAKGTNVPPGSLVIGLPARVRRPLSRDELAANVIAAEHYVELASVHRLRVADPDGLCE
jgi:carbonic anhydrase/acetyltransferase-like protein (isoleucine patch superfamily)